MDSGVERIETCNLALAAALWVLGEDAKLDRTFLDKADPRHIKIAIVGTDLHKTMDDWDAMRGTVGLLRKFADRFKDCKSFIHGGTE